MPVPEHFMLSNSAAALITRTLEVEMDTGYKVVPVAKMYNATGTTDFPNTKGDCF